MLWEDYHKIEVLYLIQWQTKCSYDNMTSVLLVNSTHEGKINVNIACICFYIQFVQGCSGGAVLTE